MTRNTKTKLLKAVCKQSDLMRAPFLTSSWSNKISSTNKKSIFVNKIGEKFRRKITDLSVEKKWPLIQKEWAVVKEIQLSKQTGQCLCGRANLKYITYLKNKTNNNEIIAGNCCLLNFQR